MLYHKTLSKVEPKDMKKSIDSSSYQIVIVVFGLFETQTAHWEFYLTSCIDRNGSIYITDEICKFPSHLGRTYTPATTSSISNYGRKLKTLDEGVKWAEEFKMKWESGSNDLVSEMRDKKLENLKIMIKSILKANSWYDNLKEPNRTLFFFFVLMPLICGSQLLLTTIFEEKWGYLYWGFWVMFLVIFRMTPAIVDIRNMHKERKKLEKDLEN